MFSYVIRCETPRDLEDALEILRGGLSVCQYDVMHALGRVYVTFTIREERSHKEMRDIIPKYLPFACEPASMAIQSFYVPFTPQYRVQANGKGTLTFPELPRERFTLGQFFDRTHMHYTSAGVCECAPFSGLRDWAVKYLCGVVEIHYLLAVPANVLRTCLDPWIHMAKEYGVCHGDVREVHLFGRDSSTAFVQDDDLMSMLPGLEELVEGGLYTFQMILSDGTAIVRGFYGNRDFHDSDCLDPSGYFASKYVGGPNHAVQMFAGFGVLVLYRVDCDEIDDKYPCTTQLYRIVKKYLHVSVYEDREYDYDTLEYLYTESEDYESEDYESETD